VSQANVRSRVHAWKAGLAQRRGDAEGAPACRLGGANRVGALGSIPDTVFTMKSVENSDSSPFLASWVPAFLSGQGLRPGFTREPRKLGMGRAR